MTDKPKRIKRIKKKVEDDLQVGDRVLTELGEATVCEVKGSYVAVTTDRGIRILIPGRPPKVEDNG